MKRALITGVTGQDGSYLAEFLIRKGYKVWGLVRRSSSFNTGRIDHIIESEAPHRFDWRRADLTDEASLTRVLLEIRPDEIYNLGAQTHVKVSFEIPVYTLDVITLGTLRLLEAIRSAGLLPKIYQAGSSEMFGSVPPPQTEASPFRPQSPYAIAKVAAHQICVHYREAYHMWIANGILFNHESPRRGETFVTRKITRAVARICLGVQRHVDLGNIDAKRDWGYAPEYVEVMWRMLQRDQPSDYVVATGEAHSVKEFVEEAFENVGINIEWRGEGMNRKAIVSDSSDCEYQSRMKVHKGDMVVRIAERNLRPADANFLLGDARKAKQDLRWKPRVKFKNLVELMVKADLRRATMILEGTQKYKEEWREFVA